jgi:pyruvate/2-oxoglutarate dehydrogenase complex dihydrolipoamide dehydrogenase (E3) component
VKDVFHAGITQRLQVLQATIYYGTCTFLDAHTIQVNLGEDREKDLSAPGGEIQLRGEKILIATGSSPPNVFRFGHGEVYDSDAILKLDRIPNRFPRPCLHEHRAGPPGYAPRARPWRKRDFPAPAQRYLHHS